MWTNDVYYFFQFKFISPFPPAVLATQCNAALSCNALLLQHLLDKGDSLTIGYMEQVPCGERYTVINL